MIPPRYKVDAILARRLEMLQREGQDALQRFRELADSGGELPAELHIIRVHVGELLLDLQMLARDHKEVMLRDLL